MNTTIIDQSNLPPSNSQRATAIVPRSCDLICDSVDELVQQGISHVLKNGRPVTTRAGSGLQAYNVNYVLMNSLNRLHLLRDEAVGYFARELVAYFRGSLHVTDGLAQASRFWLKLACGNGLINSNYGHYVFYQKVEENLTQYEWVRARLIENPDTRRAIVNINQTHHKSDTKDFPCTVSVQFFILDETLCCEVFSRSTDVITGLPYDIGFFSVLAELLWTDIKKTAYPNLKLGHTMMKTIFTQIYSNRHELALNTLNTTTPARQLAMPPISDAASLLADIYGNTDKSEFMRWVLTHAAEGL